MQYFLIPSLSHVHADNGGLAILKPGWIHPRRNLTSSVLILGLKGLVRLTVAGEEVCVAPGRMVLLPAGKNHQGIVDLEETASYYWMHFTMPSLTPLLSHEEADTILSNEGVTNHLLETSALLPFQFELPEAEPRQTLFRELLNLQEKPAYTNWKFQLQFQCLLINLTEDLIEVHKPSKNLSSSSSVVYSLLQCVAENLTDPNLSIKSIARTLELNLDYVGRRFKQIMKLSVGDFILKERMKLCILRLQQSSDNLTQVAESCGFGTLRHFLRQFKAHLGMTPSEYRTRYRMMHINSV